MAKPATEIQLPDWVGRVAMIVGVIACWTTLTVLYFSISTGNFIGCSIMVGPSALLLTYFAFGGQVPRKLRTKGWPPRLGWISVVFMISLLAFFIAVHFLPSDTK